MYIVSMRASKRRAGSAASELLFFSFNDTATTEIYTLSLHDALPICMAHAARVDAIRVVADLHYDVLGNPALPHAVPRVVGDPRSRHRRHWSRLRLPGPYRRRATDQSRARRGRSALCAREGSRGRPS